MDFVVLKVNGRDVSPQEAARALRGADEPLVVTLRRLKLATPPPATASPSASPPSPATATAVHPEPGEASLASLASLAAAAEPPAQLHSLHSAHEMHSVEVQTDELWPDWTTEEHDPNAAPERSLHDILEQDIDLEEVTLLRGEAGEAGEEGAGLGITLSCSCSSGSDDLDTEVYIASVEPTSLAGRDGRLQRGDQILQVNGEDITTRELAEHMFNSPGPSITLLVSRYFSEDDGDQDDEEVESCRRPSCGKPIKPRTPTHAKHFHGDRDDGSTDRRSDGSCDRRSDGSSDRRSDASSDRRSDTSTDRRSDGSDTPAPPAPPTGTAPTTGYVNVPPASTNGTASSTRPSSASTNGVTRRKESSRQRTAGDGSPSETAPTSASVPGRRSHRTSVTNGSAVARVPAGTRSLPGPGSLPLASAVALGMRAPSSEHIYETIPESDSEHIYCEPYEPSAEYSNVHGNATPATPLQQLLTLQLKKDGREDRTTLRLGLGRQAGQAGQAGQATSSSGSSGGSCSTMYTNAANLQHTIEVQQELFRQSLRQTTPTSSSRPPLPLPSPSGRRPRPPQPQLQPFPPPPPAPSDAKMEWKVKRRADGSRYITRRPVRTRVIREALRDRAAQIRDERAGFSTEDDTASELKMGRYWTKAERKQHVRRKRQQQHQQHQQQVHPQPVNLQQLEQVKQGLEEEAGRIGRAANASDPGHKKMTRKKSNVDDFTTVQELLAQGSRAVGANGKLLGLLSVTTV